MGECGTGKTHLATGLCVAACRQKRRARFTTTANLVNELVEARQQNAVKRVLVRWLRYDVIVLDEVGYVPLAEIGAEFLFQVIAERAERAALIVTTNLPFSEWTQVFRIRACAKPCWIASPTGRTSSRREPSLIVSAERWRYGRKRKSRSFQSFYRAKPRKGLRTRLLRNGPVIRKQGRCSEFRSIAFVFLTRKSYGVKTVMRKQLRLEPERRPTGVARERSSCVSSCRRSPPNSSRLVLLDDRVEEIADDRRCGISKLRTDVPRSICVGASPPA